MLIYVKIKIYKLSTNRCEHTISLINYRLIAIVIQKRPNNHIIFLGEKHETGYMLL
jgi:hypothetical protein